MKYIANPVEVEAEVIESVIPGNSEMPMILKLASGKLYSPNAGMIARMTPVPGDYVVTQSDGYVYLNPKEVFERKYRLAEKTRPTIEELDKILNSEDDRNVKINPDGSLTVE